MKLALLSLLICTSSLFSSEIKSQNARVTISVSNKEIKQVIDEIEDQTDYLFIYNAKKVDLNKKCSVDAQEETVKEVLTNIFSDSDIVYAMEGTNIMLMKKEKLADSSPQAKQGRFPIKGRVVDIKGVGVPGVTVLVVGSSRGVVTDVDGTFSLDVIDTDKLQFSFIGLETQTLSIKKEMIVVMQEMSDVLDEAVVVAFATQKKESVIAAVSTINPSELKIPSSNLTTSFAGRLAGVIAYQRSGEPGQDNADFFIRGVTTFGTGKANPLILIDNVELSTNDLSRLHPDDIASFSVLKDATATALYGARGANGVILVTTKEGKEGKVAISFRYENSISAPTSDTEIADPITFMKLQNEAVRTRNPLAGLPYRDADIDAREKGLNPAVYPVVDWKEMLFKDYTMNQRANLNLSGGGKVARYYVALSYSHDSGMLKTDSGNNFDNNISLNKYTVRSNININLSKTSELAIRLSGTFDDYQGPLNGGADLYNMSVKANPVLFPATFVPDATNSHAKHILFGNHGESGGYMNPYAQMLKGYRESQNTVVIAQLVFKQDLKFITDGLSFRMLGSTTRDSYFDLSRQYVPFFYSISSYDKPTDEYYLHPINPKDGRDYLNFTGGGKSVKSSLYLETALSYNKTFADKHDISGLFVYTARESLDGNADNLEKSLPGRNLGLAGRFTYGYDSRYFIEGNFGYNGSERFSANNRWGFFPSAGIGWVASNEHFWANSSFLSETFQMFKLKGTYGIVGNDAIADERFFYLSVVNMDGGKNYPFGTYFNSGPQGGGVAIERYADDKIGWEVSHKLNIGMEMKIFNALDVQVDYFREKRTNILQERVDIPSYIGLQSSPKANVGEAKGAGVDLSINYSKSFSEDLWLSAMGNFTYASSEYSVFEEPDYSETTPWLTKVGQKLSQKTGFIAERLFIDEEDVLNSPRQMYGEYMAGDIKYKDINGDNIIDDRDQVPLGYPTTPEIIYGFGFSAGYKGIDFSCFFQGSARSSFWVNPATIAPFVNSLDGQQGNNGVLSFIAEDHWSEENQNTYAAWPRLSTYTVENNNKTSTWFMGNGNFLRLKSAEIGYTLPHSISRKASIEKVRIYLSGTNLLRFSSFKLWDPEMGDKAFGYPLQQVFNVGVQLNF